jgi:hypothetical protein
MMPSPSIDHRPRTNRSRSRSAGNARTRARCSILCARAPQMSLPKLTPAPQSPYAPAKQVPKPIHSKFIKSAAAAKSP